MIKIIIISTIVLAIVTGVGFFLKSQNQRRGDPSPLLSPSSSPIANEETPTPSSLPEKIEATIFTAKGNIVLELYPLVAPKTVANFVKLAGDKFYDGTKFHRVVTDFVIQGGDPLSKDSDPSNDGTGGPGYTFEDEINPRILGVSEQNIAKLQQRGYKYNFDLKSLSVNVGMIAMANSGPNTNGSQFFIVTTQNQSHLNGLHTVFGKVIKGMDVVLKIKQGDVIQKITIAE